VPVPIIGPSYDLATPKADVQRTVNMFPVMNEVVGGKTGAYFQQVPGLDVFSEPALQNDLLVVKTQEVDAAFVGASQTYSVIATNFGPDEADGGTVTDTMPAGFTFASCDIVYAGGAAGPATATQAELLAGIVITPWPSGGTATMTITGTLSDAGSLVNTTTATPPAGHVGGGTSTASVTTTVTTRVEEDIVWDAASKSAHWVISNGGLTVSLTAITSADPAYGIRLDHFRHTGKRYLELHIDHLAMATFEKEDMCYAIANGTWSPAATGFPGNDANAWARLRASYVKHLSVDDNNGITQPNVDADGDVLMVAMDFDTGVLAFGVNGQWFNNGTSVPDQSFVPATQAFPAYTNLLGPVTMAMWGFAGSITCSYTIRTKAAEFQYQPAGWDSFALQDT